MEERLSQQVKIGAQQINGLETRLADLSEMIGEYDRQKQHDFMMLERLKEKNCHLEMENAALAKAVDCGGEKESDESNFQLKINKLEPQSAHQSDFDDSNRWMDIEHSHCQSKYEELKNEFDLYKRTSHNNNATLKDEQLLRHQLHDLKQKLNELTSDFEENEKRHRVTIASLRSSLDENDSKQKQQVQTIKNEWQTKLSHVEQQLQRQRERSFALLEEKEKEIELLKVQLGIGKKRKNSKNDENTDSSVHLLGVAVELCKLTASDKKEAQFLHYAQELARKDVEITNLRKAKHQLEANMRQLDLKSSTKEEHLLKQLEEVTEQTLRLGRNCSREGANLEYLKNVVLSYMLSSSATSRQHMLNAIATVLKFSSKELDSSYTDSISSRGKSRKTSANICLGISEPRTCIV
uniref:GRIP domain-containing protein n=1 Tax=Strigamia maritima TaxID=126957 RepID=T1J7N2_STRMM